MADRFVYDDDCGFCTWWAARMADGGLDVVGFSELADEERARLPADYEDCAHLLTDDAVYSCGAAIEEALARVGYLPDGPVGLLRRVPGYRTVREKAYWLGAENRDLLGRLASADSPE